MSVRRLWQRLLTPENGALLFTAITGVAMALQVQLSPHGIRPIVDERFYVDWARAIAAGDLMGDGPFWLDPLPAYVLGAVFAVTGDSLLAGRLVYVALGVGTVALAGATARLLWGRREGAIVMGLLALFGPHTFTLGFLHKEALAVHLTAWGLYLGIKVQAPDARARTWAALGLAAVALALTRGNAVALLPFLVAWAAARKNVRHLAALSLAVAVPLVLAGAHNAAMGGGWRPITPQAGHNFFIGNNPEASGAFDQPDFVRARTRHERVDFRAEAERRVGHELTLQETSDYWMREGLAFWSDHPLDAVGLTLKKAWLLVHDYEIPDAYPYTCFRRYFTPVLYAAPLGFGALVGLALVGMWSAAREDRRARLVVAFAVLYGGAVVVFYVFDRYRIPLCVPLCLFAARALALALERRVRPVAVAVVIAVTVLAFVPSPVSRDHALRDAFCVRQVGVMLEAEGRAAEAQPWLDEAQRLDPRSP